MFKYLKYLVPRPIYIWYQAKFKNLGIYIHRQTGGYYQYLDEKNYISLIGDPNNINTSMEGDEKIGDLVKIGPIQGSKRKFISSLKYNTALALRDRVHGRETIKPE